MWDRLVREDLGLVQLFSPPFDKSTLDPGYIKGYPPGVRENGGQYTHAAVWAAMAFALAGRYEQAASLVSMLNPINHALDPAAVERYKAEPYALAADIYSQPPDAGRGGWAWYTGSAAWMYRAWLEEILGLKVRGETLQLAPVIPSWWDGFKMSYKHGASLYKIQVENPEHREKGVAWVELDGQRLKNDPIHLVRESSEHMILVRIGSQTDEP